MLIRCLIERPGGSHVTISDKEYHFKPNESGDHVAEVTVQAHQKKLLDIKEGYEKYTKGQQPTGSGETVKPAADSDAGSANT